MENTMNTYPDELQHWGIKGMKWGIRRFQNKDGSLTDAGRKRYDDDPSNNSVSNKPASQPKKAPHEMTGKDYKKQRTDDMTDEELAAAINRSRMEQAYRQLNPEPVSKGKVLAEKILNEALIPVAVNAGKNFMDKQMSKIIDKALKDSVPKSALDKLKEESDMLDLKKKIATAKDEISKIGKEKEKSESEKAKEEADIAKNRYDKEKYDRDRANLGKDADESLQDAFKKYGQMGENIKKAKDAGFPIDDDVIKNMTGKGLKSRDNSSDGDSKSDSKPESKPKTEPKSEEKVEKTTGEVVGEGKSTSKIKQEMAYKEEARVQLQRQMEQAKINRERTERYLDVMDKLYPGHSKSDTDDNRSGLMTPKEREAAEEYQRRVNEGEAFIKRLQGVGQVFND